MDRHHQEQEVQAAIIIFFGIREWISIDDLFI